MSKLEMPLFLARYSKLLDKSGIIERIIPKRINSGAELRKFNPYLLKDTNYCKDSNDKRDVYEQSDIEAFNKGILTPIHDLLGRGGKKWRPVLGMTIAESFGRDISGSIEKAIISDKPVKEHLDLLYICGLTEIVHNGSLIHDDLEDASLMRRGDQCIHLKYGVDYAVNTGTLMYYAPISQIGNFIKDDKQELELMRIYT